MSYCSFVVLMVIWACSGQSVVVAKRESRSMGTEPRGRLVANVQGAVKLYKAIAG